MTREEWLETLRCDVLSAIAKHGGARIEAGPVIETLVDEIVVIVDELSERKP